ncbi:hypothetical protein ScPMuIL_005220, partial [Solemya velum]
MKFYLDCLGIRQSAQGWEAMQQRYLSGTGELSGRLGVRRVLKLHTTESVVETTTTTSPSVFKTAMDTVQTKPATEPLAKPVTSVAGNLGLKRKLEEQTSKTKDVKKRQKSTTTTEGGPSGGGEEAPSCSWQGDTSHVQPGGTQLKSLRAKPDEVEDEATPATTIVISPDGVMRGACNVIENVQTGGNIVAAPVQLNINAGQIMIGDGNVQQIGDNKTSLLT